MRGDRAKAKPATMQARSDRTPSVRASRAIADERDAQHERHPQALDHPGGQVHARSPRRGRRDPSARGSRRPGSGAAERALRVPQVGGPSREVGGGDSEVELGVGDDQPGGLGQGQAVSTTHAATSLTRRRAHPPGSPLAQHGTRFHVTTSLTTGTCSSQRAPPRVVARQHVHHVGLLLAVRPPQPVGDRDREQGLTELVLGLVAVAPGVAPPGRAPAEVVPGAVSWPPHGPTRWCS